MQANEGPIRDVFATLGLGAPPDELLESVRRRDGGAVGTGE